MTYELPNGAGTEPHPHRALRAWQDEAALLRRERDQARRTCDRHQERAQEAWRVARRAVDSLREMQQLQQRLGEDMRRRLESLVKEMGE